ncbi:MAG TPA: hypothetical protein PKY77_12815 [Phycisphaerae bacterium]|nr:hypothetical protein [Phycisphaerae bacterium]HRY69211.1 hypothetical protein [Phycisphaerae bacterium]HSA26172.1 hypothetical protein [Phycisphaerae bacterium]
MRLPVIFRVAVCLVSLLIGAFSGFLAGAGYLIWHGETPGMRASVQILLATGSGTGGIGGVLAGLIWCRVMFRKVLSGVSGGKLIMAGGKWGLLVGVATTVTLHVVLLMTLIGVALLPAAADVMLLIVIGLACGVVAGGIFGLLSGAVCGWLVRRASSHGFPIDVLPPVSE